MLHPSLVDEADFVSGFSEPEFTAAVRTALEGSTSSKLVQDSPVPVLLVKPPEVEDYDIEEQDGPEEA